MKILSLVGYLGMMAGLLALVFMRSVFSSSPIVIGLQIAAVLLFLWARFTFGKRSFHLAANPTPGGLVTTGPYRYIRHPIYTAFCLFVGAAVGACLSWRTALAFGFIFACALLRIFCEETLVALQYPEYREYADGTWRMVPFVF